MFRQLSSQGMTIVLSTHNLEEATALCDDVGVVNGGKVVAREVPRNLFVVILRALWLVARLTALIVLLKTS